MPHLLLLGLVAFATALVVIKGSGKVNVFAGQAIRFIFKSGSTPQNLSRLRVIFGNVTDLGGGVYQVIPEQTGTIGLPEGATIAGSEVHLS